VNSAPSTWVTLYWGIPNEQQEISQVQTLLANLGLLDSYRRRSYYNPQVDVQPDQSGTYGSATEDAIEEFQQYYDVDYTGQFGTCDQVTYNALVQQAG
jgi:peptidoglycan hydrolase-like protein with peptidoglycan-binding domain